MDLAFHWTILWVLDVAVFWYMIAMNFSMFFCADWLCWCILFDLSECLLFLEQTFAGVLVDTLLSLNKRPVVFGVRKIQFAIFHFAPFQHIIPSRTFLLKNYSFKFRGGALSEFSGARFRFLLVMVRYFLILYTPRCDIALLYVDYQLGSACTLIDHETVLALSMCVLPLHSRCTLNEFFFFLPILGWVFWDIHSWCSGKITSKSFLPPLYDAVP